nr:reverse transcriptase domain-containing protein [Tanacetum cinerariifolium]
MNMGQDRQMQMVGGNGGNQFRQYAGQNAGNPAGCNVDIMKQVIQNAIQDPRVQNVGNQNGLIGVQGNGNQNQIGNGNLVAARTEENAAGQNENQTGCYNCRGVGHYARNCTVRPRRRDAAYLQTQLLIAQKEEVGIQLQAEEYDLMAAAANLDEIEEVNANCILMACLQQASTSGTQTDSTPVYDTDGSAVEKTKRIHESKINNRVFNIGDRVLLFNSRLKIFSGKLKSRWSGPFTISQVFPYGTVELSQSDGPNFKVNGHRLKHYFGEDIPKLVIPDL